MRNRIYPVEKRDRYIVNTTVDHLLAIPRSFLTYFRIFRTFASYEDKIKEKKSSSAFVTCLPAKQIAKMVWKFFLVKIIDLMDTVFFVLRKKQNQVSFLHVYHHAGMVAGTWIASKYLAGGHVTFLGTYNED